jgi:hypothetical protein
MKTLYFDIDGTVLREGTSEVKPWLGAGALERAVRAMGFERLVCVGNLVAVLRLVHGTEVETEASDRIFDYVDGAFTDRAWFRRHLALVPDPDERVAAIDPTLDWWYMDDRAELYYEREGRLDLYRKHLSGRILVPEPDGDGADVLAWILAAGKPG